MYPTEHFAMQSQTTSHQQCGSLYHQSPGMSKLDLSTVAAHFHQPMIQMMRPTVLARETSCLESGSSAEPSTMIVILKVWDPDLTQTAKYRRTDDN